MRIMHAFKPSIYHHIGGLEIARANASLNAPIYHHIGGLETILPCPWLKTIIYVNIL
jgi:enolase